MPPAPTPVLYSPASCVPGKRELSWSRSVSLAAVCLHVKTVIYYSNSRSQAPFVLSELSPCFISSPACLHSGARALSLYFICHSWVFTSYQEMPCVLTVPLLLRFLEICFCLFFLTLCACLQSDHFLITETGYSVASECPCATWYHAT